MKTRGKPQTNPRDATSLARPRTAPEFRPEPGRWIRRDDLPRPGQGSPLRPGSAMVVLALSISTALAQHYAIDWWTVYGGNTSSSAAYSLSGTLGQPAAGRMSGGGFTLTGGFWSVLNAPPTEMSPLLGIGLSNQVVTVWWALPAADFVLHQTDALSASPVPWVQVPFPYQTNGSRVFVTLPPNPGPRFYHLRKPAEALRR